MKPTNLVMLAVGIAVLGTWSKDGKINTGMVVGGATVSLFMLVMGNTAPKLAEQFGWLMVAAVMGAYGEELFTAIGDATKKVSTGTEPNREAR